MKAPKLIDDLLVILEKKTESIGFDIDNNPIYIRVCVILTDMDFDEPVTEEDKLFVRDGLRDVLFPVMGLDYDLVFHNLLNERA